MQTLDNPRVEHTFPPSYYLGMKGLSVQHRILDAMKAQGVSKAELHRRSGVPYHAIDKFLKREGATTSAENAQAMLNALGLSADPE